MLLKEYEPGSSKDMLGNQKQVSEIRVWLKNWKRGRALLVYGPTGSGKTLSVKLLARELGYEVLESTASERSISEITKAVGHKSLFFNKKLVLIDEIEFFRPGKVMELIKKSNFPLVFISINPYQRNLTALRKRCRLVRFEKIRPDVMARFLREICKKEGINYNDGVLFQVARMSNGDMRAALLDLDILKPDVDTDSVSKIGYRENEENVFNTLKIILSSKKLETAKIALNNSEKTPDELFLWLEENAGEYKNIEDVALAYDYLSRSDIFRSRIIKRQAWNLQKYFFELSLSGFVLSNGSVFRYQYPRPHAKKNSGSAREKIAKNLHVSRKEAGAYFHIIRNLMNKTDIAERLGFDESDIEELEKC
jgi:replication factor C large subunit